MSATGFNGHMSVGSKCSSNAQSVFPRSSDLIPSRLACSGRNAADARFAASSVLTLWAVAYLLAGCGHTQAAKPKSSGSPITLAADALLPSPRLIVGRILAVD